MSEHKHHNHEACACEHHKHEECACGCHNHEHKEYLGCGCGHDHHHVHNETEQKKEILLIAISSLLFIVGIFTQDMAKIPSFIIFIIAYECNIFDNNITCECSYKEKCITGIDKIQSTTNDEVY